MLRGRLPLLAAALVFLTLAIATVRTKRPWCDEAWFANPAFSLMHTGRMATTVLEPTGHYRHPTGIQEYTYWIMPLHTLAQVPWYAIFGFGFTALRSLSVLWGLLGLIAVFEFVRIATGKPAPALIAVALLACDFVYVNTASNGRMDMMSAALGFAALAVYVRLRETAPRRAVLISHTLVAAAAFTHPVGGMVGLSVLLAASFKDAVRRKREYLLLATPPYVAFALAWGVYIAQRPDYFAAQFFSNAEGRFADLAYPFQMLRREILERYLNSYGFASSSSAAGLSKIYILVFYAAAALLLLCSPRVRTRTGSPLLLAASVAGILSLMAVDSTRQPYYLVYAIVPLAMLAAAFVYGAWTEYARMRPLLLVGLALLVAVQLSTLVSRVRANLMGRAFLPAVAFLQEHYPTQRVYGSAEIAMGLGFPSNVIDDPTLGFYTRVEPAAFVVEEVGYQQYFDSFQQQLPEVYRYIDRLRTQYVRLYDQGGYQVYGRHP